MNPRAIAITMVAAAAALSAFVTSGRTDVFNDFILADWAENGLYRNRILRFDGETGHFVGVFFDSNDAEPCGQPGAACNQDGWVFGPRGMTIGPDHNVYITSDKCRSDKVIRIDGQTGQFCDDFVTSGLGGLANPHDVAFGPDFDDDGFDDLYVSSNQVDSNAAIRVYAGPEADGNPSPGDHIGNIATGNEDGIDRVYSILWRKFDQNGKWVLYGSDFTNDRVIGIRWDTAEKHGEREIDTFFVTEIDEPTGVGIDSEGRIYVSSNADDQILRFSDDDWKGTPAFETEPFVDESKSSLLNSPREILYGPHPDAESDDALFVVNHKFGPGFGIVAFQGPDYDDNPGEHIELFVDATMSDDPAYVIYRQDDGASANVTSGSWCLIKGDTESTSPEDDIAAHDEDRVAICSEDDNGTHRVQFEVDFTTSVLGANFLDVSLETHVTEEQNDPAVSLKVQLRNHAGISWPDVTPSELAGGTCTNQIVMGTADDEWPYASWGIETGTDPEFVKYLLVNGKIEMRVTFESETDDFEVNVNWIRVYVKNADEPEDCQIAARLRLPNLLDSVGEVSDARIISGTLVSGDDDALGTHDGTDLVVRTTAGVHRNEIRVAGNAPRRHTRNGLSLRVVTSIDQPAAVGTIRLRNWLTNRFDEVERYVVGLDPVLVLIEEIDTSRYVQNDTMEISVAHESFIPFLSSGLESYIDEISVIPNPY